MTLNEIIKRIVLNHLKPTIVIGSVISIDGYSCDVMPLNGDATIPGVRLLSDIEAEGKVSVKLPGLSSTCICLFLDSEEEAFLLSASNYSKNILLGESYSVSKSEHVVREFNKLQNNSSLLIQAIEQLALILDTVTASPGGVSGPISVILNQVQTLVTNDINNEEVRHG
jgi:hypothetical protein